MRPCLSALLALLLALVACGRGRMAHGPGFSLVAEPAQVRLLPGLSRKVALTLQAEPGFRGTVQLSLPDPVPGLEARFTPAVVDLDERAAVQVVLLLAAAETAPAMTRAVVVQADAAGAVASAELAVEVPAASFFTVLTYRGSDPANFTWLAYQDGSGPWTSVPGRNGLYRLPLTEPSGRFGVLLGDVCASGSNSTWITNGFHSTLGEVQTLQALVFCNPQPGPPPVTFELSGSLAGAGGGTVLISANSGLWSFASGARDYAMKLVKGRGDLLAAAYASTQDYIPARVVVERGRDAQAPAIRDFDFTAQGEAPPPRLAIQQPVLDPDETLLGTVQYQTSHGQVAILGYGQDLAAYAPFPPALAQAGDTHLYFFQATGPGHSRVLQANTTLPPGALAPVLPSNLAPFEVTSSGGAHPRIGLGWNAVAPAPAVHEVAMIQPVGGKQVYTYLYFGRSWHGGAARMAWTTPDLVDVDGFDPGFLPQAGTNVRIQIFQSGSRSGQLPVAVLGQPAPYLAKPPDAAPLGDGRGNGSPWMQLRPLGPAALQTAPAPWLEYWSASRTQSFVP